MAIRLLFFGDAEPEALTPEALTGHLASDALRDPIPDLVPERGAEE